MSDVLDLEAIKARLAATTPGEWLWHDMARIIPYVDGTTYMDGREEPLTGNDGSLGVMGLVIERQLNKDTWSSTWIFHADDENFPEDPNDPDEIDYSKWRGLIKVENVADLVFITQAKVDVAALIAEVERLRRLVPAGA